MSFSFVWKLSPDTPLFVNEIFFLCWKKISPDTTTILEYSFLNLRPAYTIAIKKYGATHWGMSAQLSQESLPKCPPKMRVKSERKAPHYCALLGEDQNAKEVNSPKNGSNTPLPEGRVPPKGGIPPVEGVGGPKAPSHGDGHPKAHAPSQPKPPQKPKHPRQTCTTHMHNNNKMPHATHTENVKIISDRTMPINILNVHECDECLWYQHTTNIVNNIAPPLPQTTLVFAFDTYWKCKNNKW